MSFLQGKAVFVFLIWFLNICFHREKKKKVWKGNYITMVVLLWCLQKIMALYTWGIPYSSIGKDGCSYNAPHAYRLFLDLLPTTSRPSVLRLSAMTPSGWRDGFCRTSRSVSSFRPSHLSPNVHALMTAVGLIRSEWSGNKSKLDLNVLAGHLSSLAALQAYFLLLQFQASMLCEVFPLSKTKEQPFSSRAPCCN